MRFSNRKARAHKKGLILAKNGEASMLDKNEFIEGWKATFWSQVFDSGWLGIKDRAKAARVASAESSYKAS